MKRRISWMLASMLFGAGLAVAQDGEVQSTSPAGVASDEEISKSFANEPSLLETYKMAEQAIGLNPEKVAKWYKSAKSRNIMPVIEARYRITNDTADTLSIKTDPDRTVIGPDDESSETQILVVGKWDLRNFLYDNEIHNVVTANRRVLDMKLLLTREIRSIYNERRQLQISLLADPPASREAKLLTQARIDVLTQSLDALTEGGFSGGRR